MLATLAADPFNAFPKRGIVVEWVGGGVGVAVGGVRMEWCGKRVVVVVGRNKTMKL